MFDTIHVQTPLRCPHCGAEQSSLQTKEFDQVLADYKVGSMVCSSPVLTGILKESLWCSGCHEAGRPSASPVYLVIWHSVLAGVEQDLAQAEARLRAVDRVDLLGWLDEAQREAAVWRRRYHHLFSDLQRWQQHLVEAATREPAAAGEETEKRRAFRRFFEPPPEILSAPDPLLAILEANTHQDEADRR